MTQPFVIGLTGGIGSGKSAVAHCFAAHGIEIVDTDALAHELTGAKGAAMPAICAAFGQQVMCADGALDRAAMREIVFNDASARERLEAILHPMIRTESVARVRQATSPYVILAVPLLIESGAYRARCDRVLVIDCPEALQVERVRIRSGLSESQTRAIMAAQASRADRLAAADDVIDNSRDLDALTAQVAALDRHYRAMASGLPGSLK
ncbi:MAG: dephospho-CoA kinase [Betaproteobacteria bacterium]|nr:dephospho-CoA kinase [Betaproteobacteria bacterium]